MHLSQLQEDMGARGGGGISPNVGQLDCVDVLRSLEVVLVRKHLRTSSTEQSLLVDRCWSTSRRARHYHWFDGLFHVECGFSIHSLMQDAGGLETLRMLVAVDFSVRRSHPAADSPAVASAVAPLPWHCRLEAIPQDARVISMREGSLASAMRSNCMV